LIKDSAKMFRKLQPIIASLRFEMDSFFGRVFSFKNSIQESDNEYLNLGSGSLKSKGFINADFYVGFKFKFWKIHNKPDWMLDLRYPLKCKSNLFQGIYSSHTLEHFTYEEANNILLEIHRTIKDTCWLRLCLPDLRKYINFYQTAEGEGKFKKWTNGCDAIHNLTQNHGHKSVWDYNLIEKYLTTAGFRNIKETSFMVGTDPKLLIDSEDRVWESFYIEAQK
jgi:predicted SAM-dependent methyltransferase